MSPYILLKVEGAELVMLVSTTGKAGAPVVRLEVKVEGKDMRVIEENLRKLGGLSKEERERL